VLLIGEGAGPAHASVVTIVAGSDRSPFADRVIAVVADLPPGTLATYGEVAEEAGRPGAARAVGRILREHGAGLPWWRVVTASGRLVPGLETEHARRLEAEGIVCRDGRVRRRTR
jgi:methylated-DNA-protein-cysteine methyltransferase related protein